MTKNEMESIVMSAVQKAMAGEGAQAANGGSNTAGEVEKGADVQNGAQGNNEGLEGITAEAVEKMVKDAIQKQMQPKEEPLTRESLQEMIEKSVAAAMEPVLKSTGIPTNLNNQQQVEKQEEEHYLHGLI